VRRAQAKPTRDAVYELGSALSASAVWRMRAAAALCADGGGPVASETATKAMRWPTCLPNSVCPYLNEGLGCSRLTERRQVPWKRLYGQLASPAGGGKGPPDAL
jgi:hypothetical protein